MKDVTYPTAPAAEPALTDNKQVLADDQDPNIKAAQQRLANLRQKKRDLDQEHTRHKNAISVEIQQAQAYLDSLKLRASRLKDTKT